MARGLADAITPRRMEREAWCVFLYVSRTCVEFVTMSILLDPSCWIHRWWFTVDCTSARLNHTLCRRRMQPSTTPSHFSLCAWWKSILAESSWFRCAVVQHLCVCQLFWWHWLWKKFAWSFVTISSIHYIQTVITVDTMQDKTEDYPNCSVLYCILQSCQVMWAFLSGELSGEACWLSFVLRFCFFLYLLFCMSPTWYWCKNLQDNSRLWKRYGLPCTTLSVSSLLA